MVREKEICQDTGKNFRERKKRQRTGNKNTRNLKKRYRFLGNTENSEKGERLWKN
jgi:hypothetical protein